MDAGFARIKGTRVLAGPFRGMDWPTARRGNVPLLLLLGHYEFELAGVIERACALGMHRVLNPGSGTGWYAVGLALRMPQARVVAFEIDPAGRKIMQSLAAANRVAERIEVRGRCDPEQMRAALDDAGAEERVLVVCDVEGHEDALLDPARLPRLARSFILVELHDNLVPGVSARLLERFGETHAITTVRPVRRAEAKVARWSLLFHLAKPLLFRERGDGSTGWFWMEPKGMTNDERRPNERMSQ
jgi:hypothetical protein